MKVLVTREAIIKALDSQSPFSCSPSTSHFDMRFFPPTLEVDVEDCDCVEKYVSPEELERFIDQRSGITDVMRGESLPDTPPPAKDFWGPSAADTDLSEQARRNREVNADLDERYRALAPTPPAKEGKPELHMHELPQDVMSQEFRQKNGVMARHPFAPMPAKLEEIDCDWGKNGAKISAPHIDVLNALIRDYNRRNGYPH